MSINHATLEVARDLMMDEVRFWTLLGFEIDPTPVRSDKYGAVWLRGRPGGSPAFLHLFPVPQPGRAGVDMPTVPRYGHVAFALGKPGYYSTLELLRVDQAKIDDGTPYWGSLRSMLTTPSGHRVELMEFGPPQEEGWAA